jgi:flagellar basal-body rod protein FlgF
MTDVMSLSETGMINSLHRLTLTSQNLANANTNGYRREVAVSEPFNVRLEQILGAYGDRFSTNLDQRMVPQTKSVLDMAAGSFRQTGNALDFAIEGDGYFEFNGPGGVYYSRRGVFTQDASGQMVTADGLAVQGMSGPLRLSNATPRVDREGVIWIDDKNVGQLKIVKFADPTKLEKVGENYFRMGQASIVEDTTPSVVRQGHIEGSNVDVTTEMVSMMTTLRHLEMTQRLVTGYDEILGKAIDTIGEF